jgi:DNA-binding transcriptional LysR family regulator
LTNEGERALVRARVMVAEARALKSEMRAATDGLTGRLRLGVIPTALPMVADLTAPLVARHPGVRVTILSCTSAEILAGIAALELEGGLTYLDNEPLGQVARLPLYDETYCLLCRADAPLARRDRVTWAEASTQELCLLTPDMQNRRIIAQHLGTAAGTRVESNSALALVSHVRTGRWMSVVPAALAGVVTADGTLVSVPLVDPEVRHAVGLVTESRSPSVPLVGALMDEARRLARSGQKASPAVA